MEISPLSSFVIYCTVPSVSLTIECQCQSLINAK